MEHHQRDAWQKATKIVGALIVLVTFGLAMYQVGIQDGTPSRTNIIIIGGFHALGWVAFSERVVGQALDAWEAVRGDAPGS